MGTYCIPEICKKMLSLWLEFAKSEALYEFTQDN